jgi:hypothetical protein
VYPQATAMAWQIGLSGVQCLQCGVRAAVGRARRTGSASEGGIASGWRAPGAWLVSHGAEARSMSAEALAKGSWREASFYPGQPALLRGLGPDQPEKVTGLR